MIFVNVCSTWSMVELETRFETWIIRNYVNGVCLFHLSILIMLMAYLWSQRTPNFQIKYFMFDLSIYRLFGLNSGWKRDSLQWMILVYVSSTWSIVELNTLLRRELQGNDVNCISLFQLLYLIPLLVYPC
jgi:hypothetical protein